MYTLSQFLQAEDPALMSIARWTSRLVVNAKEGDQAALWTDGLEALSAAVGIRRGRGMNAENPWGSLEATWRSKRLRRIDDLPIRQFVRKALNQLLPLTAKKIIGTSSSLLSAMSKVFDFGRSESSPVLLEGETGTGKELLFDLYAEACDRFKRRRMVNCASFQEAWMYTELFGAREGSYTGCTEDREGIIQNHTVVLLDEIQNLDRQCQAALLRFIGEERHPYRPLGASKDFFSNALIVAATNAELAPGVGEENPQSSILSTTFRPDLYFRLSIFRASLPPLRKRVQDIDEIARQYLGNVRIESAAIEALRKYDWPGNVRQLKGVLEQARSISSSTIISLEDVASDLRISTHLEAQRSFADRWSLELFRRYPGPEHRWEIEFLIETMPFRRDIERVLEESLALLKTEARGFAESLHLRELDRVLDAVDHNANRMSPGIACIVISPLLRILRDRAWLDAPEISAGESRSEAYVDEQSEIDDNITSIENSCTGSVSARISSKTLESSWWIYSKGCAEMAVLRLAIAASIVLDRQWAGPSKSSMEMAELDLKARFNPMEFRDSNPFELGDAHEVLVKCTSLDQFEEAMRESIIGPEHRVADSYFVKEGLEAPDENRVWGLSRSHNIPLVVSAMEAGQRTGLIGLELKEFIAKEIGVSVSTVNRAFKKHGLGGKARRRRKKRGKGTP